MVHQDASVSERDLNELDKKISTIVSFTRKGTGPQSTYDAKSVKSSVVNRRSVAGRSHASSFVEVDPDAQIITANHGKVIGMTSAEWNNQV